MSHEELSSLAFGHFVKVRQRLPHLLEHGIDFAPLPFALYREG
jgi:hypothetical protein